MFSDNVFPSDSIVAAVNIIARYVEDRVMRFRIRPEGQPASAKFYPHVCVGILALCQVSLANTSIAVLMDKSHIVVAPDSKKLWAAEPICKIHRAVDIYWVASGLLTDEAAFFSMEHGKPTIGFVKFSRVEKSDGSVSIFPDETGILGPCPNMVHACGRLVGMKNRASQYLAAPGWERDLTGAAEKAVRLEIQEDPEGVGPPIAILRIDTSGAHWIARGSSKGTGK